MSNELNLAQVAKFIGEVLSPGNNMPGTPEQPLNTNIPAQGTGSKLQNQIQTVQAELQHIREEVSNLTGNSSGFGGHGPGQQGGGGKLCGLMSGGGPFGQGQVGSGLRGGMGSVSNWQGMQGGIRGRNAGQSNWSVTNTGTNQDQINLGNYTLNLNKANSQWSITNNQTGQTTTINGDPHVGENGSVWTFKNNTTFQLDDGTQITVKTVPAGNGETLSSELDITEGNQGMVVSGLASSDGSPLQVAGGLNGYTLGAANRGTQMVFEGDGNWQTFAGQTVDQSVANNM